MSDRENKLQLRVGKSFEANASGTIAVISVVVVVSLLFVAGVYFK